MPRILGSTPYAFVSSKCTTSSVPTRPLFPRLHNREAYRNLRAASPIGERTLGDLEELSDDFKNLECLMQSLYTPSIELSPE